MRRLAITMVIALAVLVGAAAVAGAFGGSESNAGSDSGSPQLATPVGPPLTGQAAQKASTAALRAGSGTVTSVTRDPTGDAAYAVEIRESNGTALIVELDRNFKVLSVDVPQSRQGADNAGGGDGG